MNSRALFPVRPYAPETVFPNADHARAARGFGQPHRGESGLIEEMAIHDVRL